MAPSRSYSNRGPLKTERRLFATQAAAIYDRCRSRPWLLHYLGIDPRWGDDLRTSGGLAAPGRENGRCRSPLPNDYIKSKAAARVPEGGAARPCGARATLLLKGALSVCLFRFENSAQTDREATQNALDAIAPFRQVYSKFKVRCWSHRSLGDLRPERICALRASRAEPGPSAVRAPRRP